MKHLRPSQIAQIERKLDMRAHELREDVRQEMQQAAQERHREIAGTVGDTGDESVANLVADLDAAAIDRDMRELRAIDAARKRLKDGSYGMCDDCGASIPWQRLLAKPTAARCLPCAQKREKTHAREATPSL